MSDLDETDHEILELLVEDARRPYSDIADRVGLSGPTVSDRVDRLQEVGVVRRFTADVDRSKLGAGVPVLVEVTARPGRAAAVREGLAGHDATEHVFATADGRVVATATVPAGAVEDLVPAAVDPGDLRAFDVRVLAESTWSPQVGTGAFALDCDECGNTVTEEGESVRLDGDRYRFCCPSCRENFVERYERLQEGAA